MEAYYSVTDWTVLPWIDAGMPVEPVRRAERGGRVERRHRRFDLAKVRAWHASEDATAQVSAPASA